MPKNSNTSSVELSNKIGEVFDAAMGGAKEPEVKEPEVKVEPEVKAEPEVKEPEVKEPEVKEPEVKEPEVKEPEVKEPSLVPDDVLGKPKAEGKPAELEEEEDDDEPPESVAKDDKANKAWAKTKSEKRALKRELKELKAKFEAAPAPVVAEAPEETIALRKQVQDYEAKLGQYDLASTAEFKNRFEAPMQSALRKGVSVLVRGGVEAEAAKAIMLKASDPSLSFEQVQDLITDQSMAVQGAVVNAVSEYGELATQRQEALDKWQETKAAVQSQAQMDNEIKLVEEIESGTQEAIANVQKAGNFLYQRSATDENWNKQVDERIAAAKGILRSAKPSELVSWVLEGLTAAPLRHLFAETNKVAEARKAELAKLVKVTPKTGGAGEPVAAPKPKGPVTIQGVIDDVFSKVPNLR